MASLASLYSCCADQLAVSSLLSPNTPQPASVMASIREPSKKVTLRCMVTRPNEEPNYTPRARSEAEGGPAPAEATSQVPANERVVPLDLAGLRLDQALAKMFPEHSRSRLSGWLQEGHIRVDSRP